MNFQDVLNSVTSGDSDYATAKKLGVQPQTFSNWRNGRRVSDDETLDLMVKLSGLEASQVCLAAYAEKLHNNEVAETFRHLAAH